MRAKTIVIISLLVMAMTSCNSDHRAKAFEDYIIAQSDSLAYSECTEEALQQYLKSYYKDPGAFILWVDQLSSNIKFYREALHNNCKAIHIVDEQAGCELPFSEAYKIVIARPDTTPDLDDVIRLQRDINGLNDINTNLTIWNEAKKYEQRNGYKHKPHF